MEGDLFLKVAPTELGVSAEATSPSSAAPKARTATWKRRHFVARLNMTGMPVLGSYRADGSPIPAFTWELAGLTAVFGPEDGKYKGKSRWDLALASNPKKKRVSFLAADASTRTRWVACVSDLIAAHRRFEER